MQYRMTDKNLALSFNEILERNITETHTAYLGVDRIKPQ